jgi:hypothetical protein
MVVVAKNPEIVSPSAQMAWVGCCPRPVKNQTIPENGGAKNFFVSARPATENQLPWSLVASMTSCSSLFATSLAWMRISLLPAKNQTQTVVE